MSVPWSSKKECRSFFKALCAQEFEQGLVQNQTQLNAVLRTYFSSQSGLWGAYRALPQEAQVEEVFQISHVTWVFPQMQGDFLQFLEASSFTLGPYGVYEPSSDSRLQNLEDLTGVLVPGLVFNKNGSRLGRGKGFYDRALKSYPGVKVGVCFDFQISETQIPVEPHDVKMDFLITDMGFIDCRKYQE